MKPYLVTIEGLRGLERQIWYKDGTRFVGPPLAIVSSHELPDRPWRVDDAVRYVRETVLEAA